MHKKPHVDVQILSNTYSQGALSLMIPTHRVGTPDNRHIDQTHWRHAIDQAQTLLQEHGYDPEPFLAPARELLADTPFWNELSDGLVGYFTPEAHHIYKVPQRIEFKVYVGQHFLLSPIVSMLRGEERFFILALSQQSVRFYEATRYRLSAVKIDDLMPLSLEEAVAQDPEKQLQYHSASADGQAIYHGHGLGEGKTEELLKQFLRAVDKGLMKMLHDEQVPLVLATVEEMAAAYRSINSYPHLMEGYVAGNPEHTDLMKLYEMSRLEVNDFYAQAPQTAGKAFLSQRHTELSSVDPAENLRAAWEGKIQHLMLREGKYVWGEVAKKGDITLHGNQQPHSRCLLNETVVYTYRNGGEVYRMADAGLGHLLSDSVAVFRYK